MPVTTVTLASALLEAQRGIVSPKFDSTNPHYNSRFASLKSVTEAAKDALNKSGIVLLQPVETRADGSIGVSTVLLGHGDRMDLGTVAMQLPSDPQKVGSAITYLRRYCLASALAIVADEDDDGESALPAKPAAPAAPSHLATEAMRRKVFATLKGKGLSSDEVKAMCVAVTQKAHSAEWTAGDIDALLAAAERDESIEAFKGMSLMVGGEA